MRWFNTARNRSKRRGRMGMAHRSLYLRVWDAVLGHIQTHCEVGSVIDFLLRFRRMVVLLSLP
jgi:hypothetical protein